MQVEANEQKDVTVLADATYAHLLLHSLQQVLQICTNGEGIPYYGDDIHATVEKY